MVDKILELNDEFKASYHYTNELLYYLDTNDYDKFVHTLNQEIELPKLIKTVIETTKLHIDKIQNTMNYQYTNGPIEGIIGKIKLIKRVAYGYRNFYSLKTRVNLSMLGSKLKKQEKIRVKKSKEQYTA